MIDKTVTSSDWSGHEAVLCAQIMQQLLEITPMTGPLHVGAEVIYYFSFAINSVCEIGLSAV